MYYNPDTLAKYLRNEGYEPKAVKPWNVREGDIMTLSDQSRPNLPEFHVPVIVSIVDKYAQFARPWPYRATARTAWRFWHKPVNPDDLRFLYDRHKTEGWNRFDTVDIWRKSNTPDKSTKS